ncbi:hypothetical protein LCGC14_3148280, partial [marine sediment metagenome]
SDAEYFSEVTKVVVENRKKQEKAFERFGLGAFSLLSKFAGLPTGGLEREFVRPLLQDAGIPAIDAIHKGDVSHPQQFAERVFEFDKTLRKLRKLNKKGKLNFNDISILEQLESTQTEINTTVRDLSITEDKELRQIGFENIGIRIETANLLLEDLSK